MSYRLKKNNVEKVFEDVAFKEGLLSDGWEEVEEKEIDFHSLTVEQLKSLAAERDLEYDSKIKKEDLIKLLEDAK